MAYFEKIKGNKLYLSPVCADDAELYAGWVNQSHISDRLGNTSLSFSVPAERAFLEGLEKDAYSFAIVPYELNRAVGNCSLFAIDHIRQIAEVGLFIGVNEYRGKGYGTEVLTILLNYGFNSLNLNNIMLTVFDFNQNAISCYKKVGFREIGRRRQAYFVNGHRCDQIYMDILREDFNLVKKPQAL